MKKLFVTVAAAAAMLFTSCTPEYDESLKCEQEDIHLAQLLKSCCDAAYDTHLWLSEDGDCEYYDCCWEYVLPALRAKYESGATLTIGEMEAIVAGIEHCPTFADTLGEIDEFINLHDYLRHGIE